MKKLFITTAIILITGPFNCFSQIDDGIKLIGGSLSFDVSSEVDKRVDNPDIVQIEESKTAFSILPEVGYLLTDHWAVGLKAGYGRRKDVKEGIYSEAINRENQKSIYKTNTFDAGAFGRYYIELDGNFYFFGEAGIDWEHSIYTTEHNNSDSEDKSNRTILSAGIQPGLTFFINERVGLYLTIPDLINYRHRVNEYIDKDRSGDQTTREREFSNWSTNLNLNHLFRPSSISIGLNVHLE